MWPLLISLAFVLSPSAFLLLWGYLVARARSRDPRWPEIERQKNDEEAQALRFMELKKVK